MFVLKVAGLIFGAGSALFVVYVVGLWITDYSRCRAARRRLARPPTLYVVPRDGTGGTP